ncbi:MAG: DUF465 domain-containing protein [Deltaproteobacteria bacterium]
MEQAEELLIQKHIHQDVELRQTVQEHKNLESEIENYNKRIYLTPEEEGEKKKLQKKKLQKKEQIFKILSKYREG